MPTLSKWVTPSYRGRKSGWVACLTGDQELAGPRLLRVADWHSQIRKNRGMDKFRREHCQFVEEEIFREYLALGYA